MIQSVQGRLTRVVRVSGRAGRRRGRSAAARSAVTRTAVVSRPRCCAVRRTDARTCGVCAPRRAMHGMDQAPAGHGQAEAFVEQCRDAAEREPTLFIEDDGEGDGLRAQLHRGAPSASEVCSRAISRSSFSRSFSRRSRFRSISDRRISSRSRSCSRRRSSRFCCGSRGGGESFGCRGTRQLCQIHARRTRANCSVSRCLGVSGTVKSGSAGR